VFSDAPGDRPVLRLLPAAHACDKRIYHLNNSMQLLQVFPALISYFTSRYPEAENPAVCAPAQETRSAWQFHIRQQVVDFHVHLLSQTH
jgi:hypothetical protein